MRAPAVAQSAFEWSEPVGDCVVEERYSSGRAEIICRVNHSQMARIRAAKGMLAPPLANTCTMTPRDVEGLRSFYVHMDGRRHLHLQDGGPAVARGRRPGTIAFPVPAAVPALALVPR